MYFPPVLLIPFETLLVFEYLRRQERTELQKQSLRMRVSEMYRPFLYSVIAVWESEFLGTMKRSDSYSCLVASAIRFFDIIISLRLPLTSFRARTKEPNPSTTNAIQDTVTLKILDFKRGTFGFGRSISNLG